MSGRSLPRHIGLGAANCRRQMEAGARRVVRPDVEVWLRVVMERVVDWESPRVVRSLGVAWRGNHDGGGEKGGLMMMVQVTSWYMYGKFCVN
ncbi:hypothetical protein BS47DRAFT_1336965 [Hydnum rufescens UP504]|uniref:Uncharacterized protein n=1 Tax=Hydnum rufescens UP504 TaxID=1448309 RepID=A0A9P6B8K6_9AGAM|nr:hypothetical protein BS47DRAFT_1336965 [Hydnum rufescens UP504]